MKKISLKVLSILIISVFLAGCVQEQLSVEEEQELKKELESMPAEELDRIVKEAEAEDNMALAGQAFSKLSVGNLKAKDYAPSTVLKTAYKVQLGKSEISLCGNCGTNLNKITLGKEDREKYGESAYRCELKEEYVASARCPEGWSVPMVFADSYSCRKTIVDTPEALLETFLEAVQGCTEGFYFNGQFITFEQPENKRLVYSSCASDVPVGNPCGLFSCGYRPRNYWDTGIVCVKAD